MVSLAFGLASPLSLAAPLFWAIPLVGAVIAIMTIRRIGASDGALVGRQAAVIGLALCVGSLAAAATRSIVSEQTLSYQARRRGDPMACDIEVRRHPRRHLNPRPLRHAVRLRHRRPGSPAASQPVREPLADFQDHPLVRYMASVGKEADVTFAGQQGQRPELSAGGRLTEDLLVTPAKESASPAVTVHISVQRTRANSLSAAKWWIADYAGDNLSDSVGRFAVKSCPLCGLPMVRWPPWTGNSMAVDVGEDRATLAGSTANARWGVDFLSRC